MKSPILSTALAIVAGSMVLATLASIVVNLSSKDAQNPGAVVGPDAIAPRVEASPTPVPDQPEPPLRAQLHAPGTRTPVWRGLFPERRLGVTREDVRETIRDMEAQVPDTMREIERDMKRDAAEYGLSPSDVSEQMRELEAETRRQIRDMEDDVWEELRRMQDP